MEIVPIEVRQYPEFTVTFYRAELPFYLYQQDDVDIVFTHGVPDGEYVIVGSQDKHTKVDQLDAAIKWYHVMKHPSHRTFFYNKEQTTRGFWSPVDAEEELGHVLEWYQREYPNDCFEPKQILWPTPENILPGEDGYSQGFYPQPIFKHPETISKNTLAFHRQVNKELDSGGIAVGVIMGDYRLPVDVKGVDTANRVVGYVTVGMTDHNLPELVMYSTWRGKVTMDFMMQIAKQMKNGEPVEGDFKSIPVDTSALYDKMIFTNFLSNYYPRESVRLNQIFYPDKNDKFPTDEGYDWVKQPQPFVEDQF